MVYGLQYFDNEFICNTEIGTIPRQLAWALHKDDTQNREFYV